MDALSTLLPADLVGFLLALGLGLLIGFEREEHEAKGLGGVRTFPIIALGGFLLVLAFPGSAAPFAVGFAVLGLLVAVSHWHAIRSGDPGMTTEVAVLLTFTLGGCAALERYWLAIAAGVVAVILLQEKSRLEGFATRVPREELRPLLRFLLLTGVILPVVPNRAFTTLEFNPFRFWLIVVAVSGVSYASYLLRLWLGGGRGLLLSGVLGGAYSSTVTTVALARQSRVDDAGARGYAGAILAATGVMYLRLWILVALFSAALAGRLAWVFWPLGLAGIAVGALLTRGSGADSADDVAAERPRRNPIEMTSAFGFAAVFLVVLLVTRYVSEGFGSAGLLALAAVMGAADVDPFILGLTQAPGLELSTAALAILIAAAVNNLAKGVYAVIFGDRPTGRLALALLTAWAGASLGLWLLV